MLPNPATLERAIRRNSIQSRAANQPAYNVPVGSYTPNALYDSGLLFQLGTLIEKIPEWSIYPAARDRALRMFYKTEPIASGAIYSMSARLKSLGYALKGEEDKHEYIHQLFKLSDYENGLRILISKTVTDVTSQDNGAFWELVGAGNPSGALLGDVVMGVNYLDPAQCYRTFDPEYPVLYINPIIGTRHKLHKSRVIAFSSMPQPNELGRNIGFSPLSRALLSVQLSRGILQYRYEKTTGQRRRAIGYGTGMTSATLRRMVQQAELEDESSGFVNFGGIPFFMTPKGEVKLELLDIASVPDGFDLKTETEIYVYSLALAFGVDVREFWPATQSGATKGDAAIQNMKARGKGLADLITMIEDAVNDRIMPEGVSFEFDFVDDEHDSEVANANAVVVTYLTAIKNAGGISAEQYQAHLIKEGILDEETLKEAEQIADLPEVEESTPTEDNPPSLEEAEADDSGEVDEEKSEGTYRSSLRAASVAYIEDTVSQVGFVALMDSTVRMHVREAIIEGAEDAGLLKGDFTEVEMMKIELTVREQQGYVMGVADYIAFEKRQEKIDFVAVFERLNLWVGQYQRFRAIGLLFAKDGKLKWKEGDTVNKCYDCVNLDTRVYRASIWDKYNLAPRSHELECTGFNCKCSFVPTNDPVTRGRPPALRGPKKKKEHSHEDEFQEFTVRVT